MNPEKIEKLLQNSIQMMNKILVKFFNNYQKVVIDNDDKFRSLYTNFQINYNTDVKPLDEIFINNLKKMIREDTEIEQAVRDDIVFDNGGNKRLMRLISGIITA